MGFLLLAAFIGVPLIEIALFIQVGGLIGVWPTILVVFLTAIAGAALLRHQGLGTLTRLQESLDRGEPPLDPVFDGFCLLAAGILLLTPGFFTDTLGFLLFTPPFRVALKRLVASRIRVGAQTTTSQGRAGGGTRGGAGEFHWKSSGAAPSDQDHVIDGEFEDVTDIKNHPKLNDTGPGK